MVSSWEPLSCGQDSSTCPFSDRKITSSFEFRKLKAKLEVYVVERKLLFFGEREIAREREREAYSIHVLGLYILYLESCADNMIFSTFELNIKEVSKNDHSIIALPRFTPFCAQIIGRIMLDYQHAAIVCRCSDDSWCQTRSYLILIFKLLCTVMGNI